MPHPSRFLREGEFHRSKLPRRPKCDFPLNVNPAFVEARPPRRIDKPPVERFVPQRGIAVVRENEVGGQRVAGLEDAIRVRDVQNQAGRAVELRELRRCGTAALAFPERVEQPLCGVDSRIAFPVFDDNVNHCPEPVAVAVWVCANPFDALPLVMPLERMLRVLEAVAPFHPEAELRKPFRSVFARCRRKPDPRVFFFVARIALDGEVQVFVRHERAVVVHPPARPWKCVRLEEVGRLRRVAPLLVVVLTNFQAVWVDRLDVIVKPSVENRAE